LLKARLNRTSKELTPGFPLGLTLHFHGGQDILRQAYSDLRNLAHDNNLLRVFIP
jgi:hypothetical protein